MTALSWENWAARYRQRGFNVVARSWPGMEGDIDALRADTSAIDDLGIEQILEHYEGIIEGLDSPPIIMGHSFGGAFTQILLDRGLGAAGVAIDSAPVKGLLALPASTLKTGFPVLKNPLNRHRAVALSGEDEPDPIIDGAVDLGGLAVEFMILALDPYPRKPGVEFHPPASEAAPSNSANAPPVDEAKKR
jgi:pimeloyl-ACP methyl ester carboxylesterase